MRAVDTKTNENNILIYIHNSNLRFLIFYLKDRIVGSVLTLSAREFQILATKYLKELSPYLVVFGVATLRTFVPLSE